MYRAGAVGSSMKSLRTLQAAWQAVENLQPTIGAGLRGRDLYL